MRARANFIFIISVFSIFAIVIFGGAAVEAAVTTIECPANPDPYPSGPFWEVREDDGSPTHPTIYVMEGPCKVLVGQTFPITITAYDMAWPNNWIAWDWKLTDNSVIIDEGADFFSSIDTVGGQWQNTTWITYPTLIVEHLIEFSAVDFGDGSGWHGSQTIVTSHVVIDPLPDGGLFVTPGAPPPPDPIEMGEDLVNTVSDLTLSENVENSYLANLKKIGAFLEADRKTAAINQMNAFINKVETDMAKGEIGEVEGNELIQTANSLLGLLAQ